MRIRRVAILIDGGFFIKRVGKLVPAHYCDTPSAVADTASYLAKRHVQKLIGENFGAEHSRWLDHVYRIFYYDAVPYEGVAHHPISNLQIDFGKTENAKFRHELFAELRRRRKFALRLGEVHKEDGWHVKNTEITKKLLRIRDWLHLLDLALVPTPGGPTPVPLNSQQAAQLTKVIEAWRSLTPDDLRLGLRQKGVDMRIGLDISTLTLKKQVDTIILVTGDSDFVPAAKVARREGAEFLVDPLWQQVKDDLHEHVDGIISVFRNPNAPASADDHDGDDRSTKIPSAASSAPQPPSKGP